MLSSTYRYVCVHTIPISIRITKVTANKAAVMIAWSECASGGNARQYIYICSERVPV